MKVSKERLIRSVIGYAEDEILPKIDNKATVILAAFSVNLFKMNPKLADPIFNNPLLRFALCDDGTGQYDIDTVCQAAKETLKTYGPFPFNTASVPWLSLPENNFAFGEDDIDAIRKRIERGND